MRHSFKDPGGNSLVLRSVYDAHCPLTYVGPCRIPTSYLVVTRRIVDFESDQPTREAYLAGVKVKPDDARLESIHVLRQRIYAIRRDLRK